MTRPRRTTTAAACLPICCILFLSSVVRADFTEAAKYTIDQPRGNNLIRRLADSTSQRPLHLHNDENRIDAPAPDVTSKETANGSKFYKGDDWSNDDVSFL